MSNTMKILNLTQHLATPDQILSGVFDLPEKARKEVCELLTFEKIPSAEGISIRAHALAGYAVTYTANCGACMIGGAPYLMGELTGMLRRSSIKALYSFSVRDAVDAPQADGSVRKVIVFRHTGFVPA